MSCILDSKAQDSGFNELKFPRFRNRDSLTQGETRLDEGILNFDIYILGYDIVRRDRNRNGRGVCFYFKTAINCSVHTHLNTNNLENLCLETRKPNSKPFVIVTWCRLLNSPNKVFSSLRVAHGFWVYSILGYLISGIQDFYALKLGIKYSLITNFGYKVYRGFLNFGILHEF